MAVEKWLYSVSLAVKFAQVIVVFYSNVKLINCEAAELYTSHNFDLVRTTSYPHFIMFYAPWCGHCKRVQALWDKYAEETQNLRKLKVAKVDCTQTTSLCVNENIKAYPTFRLFHGDDKYTYRGNRNIPEFQAFVSTNIKNLQNLQVPIPSQSEDRKSETLKKPVVDNVPIKAKVLNANTFAQEIEHEYTFVDFYAPWCSHCVQLEPVWDELATKFKHNPKITIAKVDCTADPDLCGTQEITAFPTLKLFQNGHLITQYKNSRSLSNLVEFVEMVLMDSVTSENIAGEELPQIIEEPDNPPVLYNDYVHAKFITAISFQNDVKNQPYVIYFHNARFQTSEENVSLFDNVLHVLNEEKDILKTNVQLAIMDCNVELEYCTGLKITSYPHIRFYRNSQQYVEYMGLLQLDALVDFLQETEKMFSKTDPMDRKEL